MKSRTAAFVLALCLASSMSFADSVMDAPLEVSDAYAAIQPPRSANAVKRHRNKKKNNTCPPQAEVKSQRQEAQQNRKVPPQTDMSPTM
jgi:hypothetical protein